MRQKKDEKEADQINDQLTYSSDIEMYIDMFCEECNPPIQDMTKESQGRWNAALMYAYKHMFSNNQLRSKDIINIPNIPKSNYNLYNYDKLEDILYIYYYLCNKYDKECSAMGFSLLTGVDSQTLLNWRDSAGKLSARGFGISQKLQQYREESLSNKLTSGKGNPVGVLAILNRWYSWNLPGVSREHVTRPTLTAADIREKLSQTGEQFAIDQPEKDG
ncbi:MAG: hypothetical protein KH381_08075 [Clostridium sp.]|nr:hypothetical protein [Clostridium sp.]